MLKSCRICGADTYGTNAKNLFKDEQQLFVHHIELLTGEWLEFNSNLPSFICIYCEQDLKVAASFRDRCIRTQKFYQQRIKAAKADPLNMVVVKLEKNPIETKNNAYAESIPSDEECEYEYDRQQQTDEIKSGILIDEDTETTVLNTSDEIEETFEEEEEYENISYEVNVDDVMGSTDHEDDSHDEMDNENLRQSQEDNRSSNASKFAVKILNHIREEKLKPGSRRKYINWKKLNDDEKRELKRLQRKRDCVCDQCGRHFTDPSNLKLHLLRHTGIKNYKCEECNAKFYTPHLLKRHSIIHTNTPPTFACQYCDKKFIYNNFKLKHERSHIKERRFHCNYCEKSFFSKAQQKEHELVHTRIRKYHCELCDQYFLRRTHLMAHYHSKTHKNMEQQKN